MPKAFLSTGKHLLTEVKYLNYESVHTKSTAAYWLFHIWVLKERHLCVSNFIGIWLLRWRNKNRSEEHVKRWVEEQSTAESLWNLWKKEWRECKDAICFASQCIYFLYIMLTVSELKEHKGFWDVFAVLFEPGWEISDSRYRSSWAVALHRALGRILSIRSKEGAKKLDEVGKRRELFHFLLYF